MTVEFVLNQIRTHMAQTGVTADEAAKYLEGGGFPEEVLQKALEAHRAKAHQVKLLKDPPAMVARQRDWYAGPAETDPCWPALRRYLTHDKKWPADVVETVDTASTRIVSLLAAPSEKEFATRGLVLGYVQSGKTANFTAVISKAADAGYKLFIVLSGLHNGLRKQTQKRLEDELRHLNPPLWHTLTTIEHDFERPGNVDAYFADNSGQRVLCVMKKNGSRLRALLKWLSTGKASLSGTPMLMIDDEADQASVDTKGTDTPSVINALILKVLKAFPKSSYVAYTATPFANVLSDTSSAELLYPRDFIVDLPRPAAYFGAERLFGTQPFSQEDDVDDGLDVIREISEAEEHQLQPPSAKERGTFEPETTASLDAAIAWFWLACAARRVRGQSAQHMSMLVHSTVYTDVHERFGELLEHHRTLFQSRLGRPEVREALQATWSRETRAVPAEALGEVPVSFSEVWRHLSDVVRETEVVVDNAKSESRLIFPPDRGTIQIVVGGNTLSRGLTIEGLTVSYYLRSSGTYDTLLQMGRWFGYRAGYADLTRIWTTADLRNSFSHLAMVEEEIRGDIALYEKLNATPADFGPKIRTHSALAITAPMKMRFATDAEISYSGSTKYTLYLDEKDESRLRANLDAARRLLHEASQIVRPERVWDRHWLFRGLSSGWITSFLRDYRAHDLDRDLRSDLLVEYIQSQNEAGDLETWNVGVVGRTQDDRGEDGWDGLMPGHRVPLLNRAKMTAKRLGDPAYLKALMSQVDRHIDISAIPPKAPTNTTSRTQPLLLLYPVNKNSRPMQSAKNHSRAPLEAVEHFVGMVLCFPGTKALQPVKYKTADIRHLEPEPELTDSADDP